LEAVKGRLQGAKREEIKQRAIDSLRSAAAIVDQKAPSDAAAYKSWLLQIARLCVGRSRRGSLHHWDVRRAAQASSA